MACDDDSYISYVFTYLRNTLYISAYVYGYHEDETYLTIHTFYVSTLICPLTIAMNLWSTFSHM
jgi:hypothetical protein